MEKAKQVGQIDPKPAIEAACVNSSVHERVVPLEHHEPFALEALHTSPKDFVNATGSVLRPRNLPRALPQ
jgi:hypothetical protein